MQRLSASLLRPACVLAAWLLTACAQLPHAGLPEPVQRALAAQGLPAGSLGIVIEGLDSREPLLRRRADEPMAPGSSMKLLTAAAGLDRLGPNHRGRTELLALRAPVDGVIEGDLYLRGGGDTDLDGPALAWLLRELREQGVREVRGALVVDRSRYQPARPELGLPPFDETPEFAYNAIPDALNFNAGLVDVELREAGGRVSARAVPALPGLQLDAGAMSVAERRCRDWDEDWRPPQIEAGRVAFGGSFPRGCVQRAGFTLVDRQWLTSRSVRQLWTELGGRFGTPPEADREAATPAGALLLASHRARPLAEVMRGLMKRSDNTQARQVFLELGVNAEGRATAEVAAERVRDWLAAKGIAPAGLVLDNGSGLSRSERIRPEQMAALLRVAHAAPWAPDFLASLPVAGQDGTLANRLKDGPATGRARLKTGTLRDAVGLAGYVRDAADREWIFVALLNDPEAAAKGRPVLDALANWVASLK